jgi:adenosine deaminase
MTCALMNMGAMSLTARAAIVSLPKAEVHVHLEGCFEIPDLVSLAAAAGEPLPRAEEQLFAFRGFDEFLEFLSWSCGLVRTAGQAAEAAYAYARRAHESGVRYADVIVNPTHWGPWRGRLPALFDAFDAGFREAEADGLPRVGLCVSLLRQQTAAEAAELVDLLIDLRHPRVVGLSVDGNERIAGRTGQRFAEAFRLAGAAGLQRTVHAGESSGADGVWDAIDLLGADRIDHGVRAIEDRGMVRELARRGIPLGVCPSSNITLGLYEDLEHHPLDRLRRQGVRVSVNSDDPAFLGIDLAGEYLRCVEAFNWGTDELRQVAATSIDACFADEHTKSRLLTELSRWDPQRSAA